MGTGFSNVAHFKKWYKKAYLGIADFSMLQAFSAWNLSVDAQGSRGGAKQRRRLLKWEFYAVAAEEFMTYVDVDEMKCIPIVENPVSSHKPSSIPIDYTDRSIPTCIVCSMEESVAHRVLGSENRNARKYARRKNFLAICADPYCKISAHVCCPEGTKLSTLPQFKGMSCFDIAHSQECQSLFTRIERGGKTYFRSKLIHKVIGDLKQVYSQSLPRRSNRGRPAVTARRANPISVVEGYEEEEPLTPRSGRSLSPPRKRSPREMTPPLKSRLRGQKKVTRKKVKRKKFGR